MLFSEQDRHDLHRVLNMEMRIMAKFDLLNSKLDTLKDAIASVIVPEAVDDSADVKALEDKVDGLIADAKAKGPAPKHDPDTAGTVVEPAPVQAPEPVPVPAVVS